LDPHPESTSHFLSASSTPPPFSFFSYRPYLQEPAWCYKRERHLDAIAQHHAPLRHAGPHALSEQLDNAGLPRNAFGVPLRFAAGGQQLPVQTCQFGTPGVVVLIQPVGQDEPAVLGKRIADDSVQKAGQLGHFTSCEVTR